MDQFNISEIFFYIGLWCLSFSYFALVIFITFITMALIKPEERKSSTQKFAHLQKVSDLFGMEIQHE